MERPPSTLLSPPDPSEVLVLERVLLRLGALNQIIARADPPVRQALEGRGLILATCAMLTSAAQAQAQESPVQPVDLYCALYGISLPDHPAWALSARARYLALKLDTVLQRRPAARLGDWLGDGLGDWLGVRAALAPALPPADPALGVPRLYRGFELLRLACLHSRRQVECWGALPFALVQTGITPLPVVALTLAHAQLGVVRFDPPRVRTRLLGQLDARLADVTALAARLADAHAQMQQMLACSHKTAGLARLAALVLKLPVVSPRLAAQMLALDLPAAGRLCDRATELGLLQRVTTRTSWKVYAASWVQDRYGLRLPVLTKSQAAPPPAPQRPTAAMADVDALFAALDAQGLAPAAAADAPDEAPDDEGPDDAALDDDEPIHAG